MTNYEQQAINRVKNSRFLGEYYHILVEYQWDNQENHLEWVATAPIDEILDWCRVKMRSVK